MALYETHAISSSSRVGHQTPFCASLRSFISGSRECQTLFANCEGAYERRVAEEGNFESLKTFIYNSMYYELGKDFSEEQNQRKTKEVESIYKEIIAINRKYGSHREIYYSAVWVHYFPYETRREQGFPVFKIYTNRNSNMAVFLDIKRKMYESWDNFLETADFPEAFLCVPRHGEYFFDKDEQKLDLEFVSFRKSSDGSSTYSIWHIFRPFCQVFYKPLLETVMSWTHKLIEKLGAVATIILNHRKSIVHALLFGFQIVKYIKHGSPESLADIKNSCLMFMGSFASRELCNELEPSTSCAPNVGASSSPNFSELRDVLQSPKKNWKRILELFLDVTVEYGPQIILKLQILFPGSPVLAILSLILAGLGVCRTAWKREGSDYSRTEGSNLPEIGGSNLPAIRDVSGVPSRTKAAGGVGSSSESCHYSTGSRLLQPETGSAARGVVDQRRAKWVAPATVLPVLKILGRKVVENIEDVLPTPSSFRSLTPLAWVTIQDVSEFHVVIMLNTRLPELVKDLEDFLGTKVDLKKRKRYLFDVMEGSREVGNLGFPMENMAIGLFRTEKIRRRPAIEILEKSEPKF